MRRLALLAPLLCSGCISTIADADLEKIKPSEVKEIVHCEIATALATAKVQYPALKDYAAKYSIKLNREKQAGAGLTALNWIIPSSNQSLALGAGAAVRDRGLETTLLEGRVSKDGEDTAWCVDHPVKPFRGALKAQDWFAESLSPNLKPGDFGRTIEFAVTYDGNLRPAIGITNLSASGGFDARRIKTNTLVVAFYEVRPTPPTEVIIVGGGTGGEAKPKGAVAEPAAAGNRILDILLNDLNTDR
ncbi:hypothetical protein [Aquibium microcysteis]|uniref:hypothetical protein n=1 Tax=Aquibium microcysteis TaxID=675281 RepID=UPI00165D0C9A|nr:hypothetical protein [Aquibium microcysteis]